MTPTEPNQPQASIYIHKGAEFSTLKPDESGQPSLLIKTFDEDHQHENRYENEKIVWDHLNRHTQYPIQLAEDKGNTFNLVFRDFDGISLKNLIKEQAFSITEFLSISIELFKNLELLYEAGIVHCDLHPNHILVERDSMTAAISDFGSAIFLNEQSGIDMPIQKLSGELFYIAPEQTGRLNQPVDFRSDLYAMGAILYEVLCGLPPFQSEETLELIHAHIAQNPVPPKERNNAIPEILSDIILKLLQKNGDHRYQTPFGVRHDLEQCLDQWQQIGSISSFSLGLEDVMGRLQISSGFYGREKEISDLKGLFDRIKLGNKGVVFVSGSSGVGKTALINELLSYVSIGGGRFISGKFDRLKKDVPYNAWNQAFSQWVDHVLTESNESIAKWNRVINDALGPLAGLLTDLIPSIELIIGEQPMPPEVGAKEAQNRFNYTIDRFLQIISGKQNPLVIFLDDSQWSENASFNLIERILFDSQLKGILIVSAFQPEEVKNLHPLQKIIDQAESFEGMGNNKLLKEFIHLQGLSPESLNKLISDSLNMSTEWTMPLSNIIFSKTQGNAFFALQYLNSLYNKEILYFDFKKRQWKWDLELVRSLEIADNVIEFLIDRFSALQDRTLQMLKLAACIGNPFDLQTLSVLSQTSQEETSRTILEAMQDGIVMPTTIKSISRQNGYFKSGSRQYRFAHDRILQALYTIVSKEDSQRAHYTIGKLLLANTEVNKLDEHILDIVNQLNKGIDRISSSEERLELAELNLKAGYKARRSNAYELSLSYFQMGIQLLNDYNWHQEYSLLLNLYNAAGEAAYLVNDLAGMNKYTGIVLENTTSILDKISSYELRIFAARLHSELDKAVDLGIEVLKELDFKVPANPSKIQGIIQLIRVKIALSSKSIQQLEVLPRMSDAKVEAGLRIISALNPAAFFARPSLIPATISITLRKTIENGNHPYAAAGYAAYGLILCAFFNDSKNGNEFGDLSEQLMEDFQYPELEARTLFTLPSFVRHWQYPLSQTIEQLEQVYLKGLETGDHEFVGFGFTLYAFHSFWTKSYLPDLAEKTQSFQTTLSELQEGAKLSIYRLGIFQQVIQNLTRADHDPLVLTGDHYHEEDMLKFNIEANDLTSLSTHFTAKLVLAVLFDQYNAALEIANKGLQYIEASIGLYQEPIFYFFHALALIRSSKGDSSANKQNLKLAKKYHKKFVVWAKNGPENYANKADLIKAELLSASNKQKEASYYYQKSIDEANSGHFLCEEAMAWEYQANNFKIMQDGAYLENESLRKAYSTFKKWGATVKMKHMEDQYPFIHKHALNVRQARSVDSPLQSNASEALDFQSIIKATTAISGEIVLEKLLGRMMSVVVENAGAQYGVLILQTDGVFSIKAALKMLPDGSASFEMHNNMPISESNMVPKSIINYVIHKGSELLLDDASESSQFSIDPYITANKSVSVLCTPIIYRGDLLGVLYLENNLTTGVFTSQRAQILSLLAGQIAVSLENVQVYEGLENTVKERTSEIEIEKEKSDTLLLNILPNQTALELKKTGKAEPKYYSSASVMFIDFKNFTVISRKKGYKELVKQIDDYFQAFDKIIDEFNIEKIKTIGDAYMCVSGLPEIDALHAQNLILAALKIEAFVSERKKMSKGKDDFFETRIGIHSGPVISGVVGSKKFAYDIWGDTVNVAARVEANGKPGEITISENTYQLVKDQFKCVHQGKVPAKNIGEIDIYYVQKE